MNSKRSFKAAHGVSSLHTLALAFGVAASGGALAQEQSKGLNNGVLEEIVVTAQRREQRLQEVPLSVTALSGAALDEKGALTFQDYAGAVPSLSFRYVGPTGNRGVRDYAIRGIYGSNTVGFYVDDTPVPIIDPELLDVSRIEVLRGPQATLYGSNSMGGTIKFITNPPQFNEFSGSAQGRVASIQDGGISDQQSMILNVPLVDDQLAARVAVSRREDGGFIDNYFDGYPGFRLNVTPTGPREHGIARDWNKALAQSARASLRYQPIDALTITPTFSYTKTELDNAPTYFGQLPGLTTVSGVRVPETEKTVIGSLNVRYGHEQFEVVNNFAYYRKLNTAVQDGTQLRIGYVPATPYDLDTTIRNNGIHNELRAQSDFSGPLNFTLGTIYARRSGSVGQFMDNPGLSAANPLFPPIANDLVYQSFGTVTTTERSAYAEGRVDVTDTFEVTAGLRYYSFETHTVTRTAGLLGDRQQVDLRMKEDGVRPRLTLSWIPSEELTLFSNFGKGFRPGQPGARRASACGGVAPDVVSDTVTNYEIGAKAALFDNRLHLTQTVYRMDWDDVQQTILLPCGFQEVQNTGKARSQGVEFEFSTRPLDALSVDGSATYTDAKIVEAERGALAPVGSPILFVPEWKLNLGVGLEGHAFANWAAFGRVDASYESRVLIDYALQFSRGGYPMYSARAGIKNDRWTLEVFGQNLSNELPFTNYYTFAVPVGSYLNSTLQPRTIGVRASLGFGAR
jgi:outer membrane receptor protein involved in Fe transport